MRIPPDDSHRSSLYSSCISLSLDGRFFATADYGGPSGVPTHSFKLAYPDDPDALTLFRPRRHGGHSFVEARPLPTHLNYLQQIFRERLRQTE